MPESTFSRPGQTEQLNMNELREQVREMADNDLGAALSEYQTVFRQAESQARIRLNLTNLSDQIRGNISQERAESIADMARETNIQAEVDALNNPQLNEYRAVLSEAIAQQVKDSPNYMQDMMSLINDAGLTLDLRLIGLTAEAVTREVYRSQTTEILSGLNADEARNQREAINDHATENVHDNVMTLFICNAMLARDDQFHTLIRNRQRELIEEATRQAGGVRPLEPVGLSVEDFANLALPLYNNFIQEQGLNPDAFGFNANDGAARELFLGLCQRPQHDLQGRLQLMARSQAEIDRRMMNFHENMRPRIEAIERRMNELSSEIIALESSASALESRAEASQDENERNSLRGQAAANRSEIIEKREMVNQLRYLTRNFRTGSRETQDIINRFDARRSMVDNADPRVRVSANSPYITQVGGRIAETVIRAPARLIDMGMNILDRNKPVSLRDMSVANLATIGGIGVGAISILISAGAALSPGVQAVYNVATGNFGAAKDNLIKLPGSIGGFVPRLIAPGAIIAGTYALSRPGQTERFIRRTAGGANTLIENATGVDIGGGIDTAGSYLRRGYNGVADYLSRGWNSVRREIDTNDIPDQIRNWMRENQINAEELGRHFECRDMLLNRLKSPGGPFQGKDIDFNSEEFNKFLVLYNNKHLAAAGNSFSTPPSITIAELHDAGIIEDDENEELSGVDAFSFTTEDRALIDRILAQHQWAYNRQILPS